MIFPTIISKSGINMSKKTTYRMVKNRNWDRTWEVYGLQIYDLIRPSNLQRLENFLFNRHLISRQTRKNPQSIMGWDFNVEVVNAPYYGEVGNKGIPHLPVVNIEVFIRCFENNDNYGGFSEELEPVFDAMRSLVIASENLTSMHDSIPTTIHAESDEINEFDEINCQNRKKIADHIEALNDLICHTVIESAKVISTKPTQKVEALNTFKNNMLEFINKAKPIVDTEYHFDGSMQMGMWSLIDLAGALLAQMGVLLTLPISLPLLMMGLISIYMPKTTSQQAVDKLEKGIHNIQLKPEPIPPKGVDVGTQTDFRIVEATPSNTMCPEGIPVGVVVEKSDSVDIVPDGIPVVRV